MSRVAIAVEDHGGAGPDVLLLHGAARTLLDWALVVDQLRDHFRLVSMDFRGHGKSEDGPWSWAAVLDDIAWVIQRLKLEAPAVVGHSLGGMVAAMCARDGMCSAAINLDGHGLGHPGLYEGLSPDLVCTRLAAVRLASRAPSTPRTLTPSEADALVMAQVALAAPLGVPAPLAEQQVRRALSFGDDGFSFRPTTALTHELLDAVEELDAMALWRNATRPLLVVNATRPDTRTDNEDLMAAYRSGLSRALAEHARSHPFLEAVDVDADHGLLLNQPELVARLADRFLTSHSVAASRSRLTASKGRYVTRPS